MRGTLAGRLFLTAILTALAPHLGLGADNGVVSSMRNVNAVMEAQGFRINPAFNAAAAMTDEDLSPPQAFEIVRPEFKGFTIGRLFTSCSCIQLESPKRRFDDGERAILQLRNIKPTPVNGQIYAIYVQITSPVRATLRFDTFVQSNIPGMMEGERDDPARLADIDRDLDTTGADDDLAAAGVIANPEGLEMVVPSAGTATLGEADAVLAAAEAARKEVDQAIDAPTTPPTDATPSGADDFPDVATQAQEAFDEVMRAVGDQKDENGGGSDPVLAGAYPDDARGAVAAEVDARVAAATAAANELVTPPAAAPRSLAPPVPMPATQPVPVIDDPEIAAAVEQVTAGLPAAAPQPVDFPLRPNAPAAPAVPAAGETAVPASEKPLAFISLLTIGVKDLGRSMDFYNALGWEMAPRGKYDQTAMFQLNGQVLVLYPITEQLREQNMQGSSPAPGGITPAIHVLNKDDVRTVYQRFLDAGGIPLKEPAEMLSGSVTGYIADPDGNPWEISWVPRFRVDGDGRLWLP